MRILLRSCRTVVAAVLALWLLEEARGVPAQQGTVEQLEGTLLTVWGDPHPLFGTSGDIRYSLVLPNGEVLGLQLGGREHLAAPHSGKRVIVSGRRVARPPTFRGTQASEVIAVDTIAANPTPQQTPSANAVVAGTRRIIYLLVKFSDDASVPHPPSFYTDLNNPLTPPAGASFPATINGFFTKTSWGQLSWQGEVGGVGGIGAPGGWLTLPYPKDYYAPCGWGSACANLSDLASDAVALATAQGISFASYDNINFVLSNDLDCCAWGGGYYLDGKVYGATWEPPWGQETAVYAHELGHSIGLPHSGWVYYSYDSPWDVMSAFNDANSTVCGSYSSVNGGGDYYLYCSEPGDGYITAHKDVLGWIPPANTIVTDTSSSVTVTLEGGALPLGSALKMIKICLPGLACTGSTAHYFTVEARVRDLGTTSQFDNAIPGEGVIIHDVQMGRPAIGGYCYFNSQSGWALPVDATPGDFDSSSCSGTALWNAQWTPGQTYTNNTYGFSVSVVSRSGSTFVVSISSPHSTLSTTVSGFGAVISTPVGINCWTGTCSANFLTGSTVQLTATAASSYAFAGWGGACSGMGACSVAMTAAKSVTATFALAQLAQMTSPAPGTTLTASKVTFQWAGGSGVTQYWLTVGGNGVQLYNQGSTQLSATVANLPTDGSAISARLYSLINGAWVFNDYTYTATASGNAKAQLISPSPGSTLAASRVTFQWTGGSGVTQYWLYVGANGTQIYNQGGTELSATIANLPTNGGGLAVRLYSLINGAWQFNDYTFTAASGGPQKAQLTIPAPGSTLTASTAAFQWTGGIGVTQYWLYVGANGIQIYNQGGTELGATVGNLPSDGSTVFARLYSLINGAWQFNDYTLTAQSGLAQPAQLTSPAPASTLTSSTATFQWTSGVGVLRYTLLVGFTPGGGQMYAQDLGTQQSATVTNLPIDGSTIYVSLSSFINGTWLSNEYTLTAVSGAMLGGQIFSPAPGSTLNASTVKFQWTGGIGATQYWLYAGANGAQIYNQGTAQLGATVANLPDDGSFISARLYSLVNGVWLYNDYLYNAVTSGHAKAQLTSPASGSTLGSSTVNFQWTGGVGVTQYWLYVAANGTQIYNQGGTELDATVANLPTNGNAIVARLYSLISGAWQFNDYALTAATGAPEPAQLASPAPGSTLAATTVAFEWTGGRNASQYWLYVGTTPGGSQLYNQDRGTQLTATVANLPTAGQTLYVRLWSRVNGAWQFNDYTLTALSGF